MFGTLGGPELFLIFVVALIIFGPRKLPEIGKSLGKMMAEFRKASNEFRSTIESEVEAEKIRDAMRIEAPRTPTPSPYASAESAGAPSSSEPTVSPAPGTPAEAAASYPGEPTPASPAENAAPAENAPHANQPAPETVRREDDSTPIEPK